MNSRFGRDSTSLAGGLKPIRPMTSGLMDLRGQAKLERESYKWDTGTGFF